MFKKILITIFFLSLTSYVYAQQFGFGFNDFPSNHANGIFTDTSKFTDGVLGASDYTVQRALQTLNASTVSVCFNATDIASRDFCFSYSTSTQQLSLYVNGSEQAIWPSTAVAVTDVILMESDDAILMENGTDRILLES